jgi:hypothetical protein
VTENAGKRSAVTIDALAAGSEATRNRGRLVIVILSLAMALAWVVIGIAYPAFELPGFGSAVAGMGATVLASLSGVLLKGGLRLAALEWATAKPLRTALAPPMAILISLLSWFLGVASIREKVFICNDAKRVDRGTSQSANCLDGRTKLVWWDPSNRSPERTFKCGGYEDDVARDPRAISAHRDSCPKDPCKQPVGLAWDGQHIVIMEDAADESLASAGVHPTATEGGQAPTQKRSSALHDLEWLTRELKTVHDHYGFYLPPDKTRFTLVAAATAGAATASDLPIHLCPWDKVAACGKTSETSIGVGSSVGGPDRDRTAIHVVQAGVETGTFFLGRDATTWCSRDGRAIQVSER